jgi:hypothetical protein
VRYIIDPDASRNQNILEVCGMAAVQGYQAEKQVSRPL